MCCSGRRPRTQYPGNRLAVRAGGSKPPPHWYRPLQQVEFYESVKVNVIVSTSKTG